MSPTKSKEPQTDDEKFLEQLQHEHDLGRLQRQYASLESDRNQFAGGAKLAKQNRVLAIFQKEHNNILTDLYVADAPGKKKEDAKLTENLQDLLSEYDVYTALVKKEKEQMREIEGQIKMIQKDVQALKAQQITDSQYSQRVWQAMVTLDAVENKLEVQVKKFSCICWKNRLLREEINHQLRERENFMKIWDKMIEKLNFGKQYMLDLIEQATIAYDQREEWCSKLQALRIKAHHDLLFHTAEMREFKRKEDNTQKLCDFLTTKGQRRVMLDLERKELEKRQLQRQKLEELVSKYRAMLDEILEFAHQTEVEAIAKKFVLQENENFSLFNAINDSIREMEDINEKLGPLHELIQEKQLLHNERIEQQRTRLERMQADLDARQLKQNEAESEFKQLDTDLNGLMQGIGHLFKLCRCDNDPLLKLLGDNENIRPYNVLLYQELLENRVLDVMLTVYDKDKLAFDKKKITAPQRVFYDEYGKPMLYPIDKLVDSNPCPLCVEHEMVGDVIDRLQKVMSRVQVVQALSTRLALPDGLARIHNVSNCHLPKSRQIIQKRYQS